MAQRLLEVRIERGGQRKARAEGIGEWRLAQCVHSALGALISWSFLLCRNVDARENQGDDSFVWLDSIAIHG